MVPEPISTEQDHLSLVFGALADPTRRDILTRLAHGNASVAELARPYEISVRAVSKHIGVLERAGLIKREKDAQRRPSRIEVAPLREAYTWLESYRKLWEQRFDRMDALLSSLQNGGGDV